MSWCLMSAALFTALLALAALIMPMRRPRFRPQPLRLSQVLRGCLALVCLLIALTLLGLGLALAGTSGTLPG